jgi:hypothetical protein
MREGEDKYWIVVSKNIYDLRRGRGRGRLGERRDAVVARRQPGSPQR